MSHNKVKTIDNFTYNQNWGFLFIIAICGLLIFFTLDTSVDAVIFQPYYTYPALIIIVGLPIIWLAMVSYWRLIHPIIAVAGGLAVIYGAFSSLTWIIVWGHGFRAESVVNGLVLTTIVVIALWRVINIKKYRINRIIMSIAALIFVVGMVSFLNPIASNSFHIEITDSVILGQYRYIVTRHRSHIDVEQPTRLTLYQCNSIGIFCRELYRGRGYGYPDHHLNNEDTIRLHDGNNIIYEYHP